MWNPSSSLLDYRQYVYFLKYNFSPMGLVVVEVQRSMEL